MFAYCLQFSYSKVVNRCVHQSLYPETQLSLTLVMQGCLNSLDWTTGLDYWTGLLDSPIRMRNSAFAVRFQPFTPFRLL